MFAQSCDFSYFREENDIRDVKTRSPLNATERAQAKNHNDYSSVINRPSSHHQESAKTMSPGDTSCGRRDRSRDRAPRYVKVFHSFVLNRYILSFR